MNLTNRPSGSTKASSQIPRSPTVPQPRRSTLVDSTTTRPAPPAANFPAFIRCQSVGNPFTAEYWCIGGTTMRLRSSTPRMLSGENSNTSLMADPRADLVNRGILMARGRDLITGMLQHYYSRSMVYGYTAGIELILENKMYRRFFIAWMLALGVCGAFAPAHAQERIGRAALIRNDVSQISPRVIKISTGDEI